MMMMMMITEHTVKITSTSTITATINIALLVARDYQDRFDEAFSNILSFAATASFAALVATC